MRPHSFFAAATFGLALLLVAGLAPRAQAATREFYFAKLGSERGLSQNSVTAFAQDRQGFVWVGTQGGLHRYDGQRYVPYRHDPRDPASLPDSYVTALVLEDDDALWVGTYSQHVARLDLRSGRIRRYAAASDGNHADHQVMTLLPHAGHLWVGTVAGLERLDPASGARTRVLKLDPQKTRDQPWQSLAATADGALWYATSSGLFRIDDRGGIELVGPPVAVRALRLDHRGQLWIGRIDGLHRLHSDGRKLVPVWINEADATGARASEIRAIVEAPDHRLWLSVFTRGLARLNPDNGQVESVHEQPSVLATLPEDTINALMIDSGGMLWAGGNYRGVTVTDPRGARFRYVIDLDGSRIDNIASDSSVRSMIEAGGALWIGTDTNRMLRYDLASDTFENVTAVLPDAQPRRIMTMARAEDGRLWLATSLGLLHFDPLTRVAETVDLGPFTRYSERTVLRDRTGALWIGTTGKGLLRRAPDGTVTQFAYKNGDPGGISHPVVHALLEDRRGRIWIGTGGGLDMFDPTSNTFRHYLHAPNTPDSLPGNLVRALLQDGNGTLWVGTHAGLSRMIEDDRDRNRPIRFEHPLAEALGSRPVPVVFSLAEAGGALWMGTGNGLMQFEPRTGYVRSYGLADGVQDLEFNGGAVARLYDGRLVFGGVRGFNLFDPQRIHESAFTAPVRLLAARVGADAPSDAGALWQPAQLQVADGADILRLRVGALDFDPAADIRYRYRMDGFDQGWIENGSQQDITYTRLPPGDYTFRAQASNRDGQWSPQELSLPVHIAPPLWRHPLAIAAAALLVLGIAITVGWRHRRQRRIERGWFRQIREREERLKLALWASGEQFWDYDLARKELHRMRADENSQTPEASMQTQIEDDHEIHPEDLPRVNELMRQHLQGEAALFLSEHRVRSGSGWSWVRARGRVVERDVNGRAQRVAGTARDITAIRSAERDRRIASEVLRSMAEAVCVFDSDFHFISVNPAFTRMTGYSDTEVIGRSTSLLDSLQHDAGFYSHMREELQRTGHWAGEVWQQRKDGQEFLCWLQSAVVLDASGQRSHFVAVLGDITDQKRAEQELRYLANYDTLTSLPNRTLLSERLSRAIVRARRQETRIAVLFLDLDRFKDINDSLGHAAGDRILRAAATRLQTTVGAHHTVARLGGDEFTVVLENLSTVEEAERIARALISAFEQPLDFDERHDVVISPSIGISLYPDHAQVPTDLIKHADTAMYQAKAAGRRTFMRYTEAMDVEIRRRATISAALRKVLDRHELRLVYQPKLSLSDGRITGVEALLRWRSAEHGDISPVQFIPLAEESGQILEIGEWVMREACAMLQTWRTHGLDELSMAVNVSALQLLRGDLPDVVSRALADTGVPANRLELELTESVIMANADQTAATLHAFRALGVGLAIDDFGTGYSSLSYLKRLPISTLKIDKEFIDDLTRDADDEAITSTVITMAHSLGLNVVAEGVENPAQMQFLRDHGCDEIQGYWLSRPLEAEACLAFILERVTPQVVSAAS